ncbi:A24 family peptidase [Ruegeria arenilitoris]|uniref:A24 family peptidase n=1 Tax=Ruegeria arenilitoris TaxID=1173585 RepID=UPI001480639D|nr:prepilin peptidase [Ruegeria arenilitoris]
MMIDLPWHSWVPLWFMVPLFVAVAWTDLTEYRIPNLYCLIGVALFLVGSPALGLHEVGLRLIAAGLCFGICFALFAAGWLGGGDAKMLPVVFLAIPTQALSTYMLLLSAAMAFGLTSLTLLRLFVRQPTGKLAATLSGREFPLGIAIGLSGLILAGWSMLLYSA